MNFEECDRIIKETWSNSPPAQPNNINGKNQFCIKNLSKWNQGRLNNSLKGAISRVERDIQKLQENPKGPNADALRTKECELDKLLKEEEIYWKIRLREEWLKWGDKNTKWFHQKASHRKRTNKLEGIFDLNDRWKDKEEDIRSVATEYFKKIFTSPNPKNRAMEDIMEVIHNRISSEESSMLDREFREEEIFKALKDKRYESN